MLGKDSGFTHAHELVSFIKAEFGDWFGIAVAGHPEGHFEGESIDEDLKFLKQKIDKGGDFICTQFFYDVDVFKNYVDKCRGAGITCPIIPGIMPIQSYSSFCRMTQFCRSKVPDKIFDRLGPVKDDDEAVKIAGIEIATEMCTEVSE